MAYQSLTRKRLLQSVGVWASAWAGGLALGSGSPATAQTKTAQAIQPAKPAQPTTWRMPDEAAPHARTWMAFGASRAIWGTQLLPEVQRNLATIALAIARYEPVSMLVRSADLPIAQSLMGNQVNLVPCPLDDLWVRDTGPVFVRNAAGQRAAVDFNFNGWGQKQAHAQDAKVAGFITRLASEKAAVQGLVTRLVLEGGGIEVDGEGSAIITESCVLNTNRNPGLTKAQCEQELARLLGIQKVIWLPGVKGKDITDGHTDFYARFTAPGVVVAALDTDPQSFDHAVTQRHLQILRTATDAQGRTLQVVVLQAPTQVRPQFESKEFAAGYINFYVCNGAVIAPEFGDTAADAAAQKILQNLFKGRDIVQLNIDALAAGGGGIHCATQQEPTA